MASEGSLGLSGVLRRAAACPFRHRRTGVLLGLALPGTRPAGQHVQNLSLVTRAKVRADPLRAPSRLPADYPFIPDIVTRDNVVGALGRPSIQQPALARFLAQGSVMKSDALPAELRDQDVTEHKCEWAKKAYTLKPCIRCTGASTTAIAWRAEERGCLPSAAGQN